MQHTPAVHPAARLQLHRPICAPSGNGSKHNNAGGRPTLPSRPLLRNSARVPSHESPSPDSTPNALHRLHLRQSVSYLLLSRSMPSRPLERVTVLASCNYRTRRTGLPPSPPATSPAHSLHSDAAHPPNHKYGPTPVHMVPSHHACTHHTRRTTVPTLCHADPTH